MYDISRLYLDLTNLHNSYLPMTLLLVQIGGVFSTTAAYKPARLYVNEIQMERIGKRIDH